MLCGGPGHSGVWRKISQSGDGCILHRRRLQFLSCSAELIKRYIWVGKVVVADSLERSAGLPLLYLTPFLALVQVSRGVQLSFRACAADGGGIRASMKHGRFGKRRPS